MKQKEKAQQDIVAEPQERFQFKKALENALSPEGYRFRISSGDEFVLFARSEMRPPTDTAIDSDVRKEEELKLDLFHLKDGKLEFAAFADASGTHRDGSVKAISAYAILERLPATVPQHIKDAEKMRNREEGAEGISVADDYSTHYGGKFKGIGLFMLGFEVAYFKSAGATAYTFFDISEGGEKLIKSFCAKAGIPDPTIDETRTATLDLTKLSVPKPEIKRVWNP